MSLPGNLDSLISVHYDARLREHAPMYDMYDKCTTLRLAGNR
jgi:hypothetical protein